MRNWSRDQRGHMWPTSTYSPITGDHQLFSFLSCFPLQPFNQRLLLLSTCHLDDIVLYLWEWLVSNPQGSQWLSTPSPSDRYFHLQGLAIMLLFEHRTTHRAESTLKGQTELHDHCVGPLNAVECSIRWPFQKVQITVLSWAVWWITQFDRTQVMHAEISCPRRHVISLTHAIKDYLCEQITDLNPWPSLHLESRAPRSPAHHVEQITIPSLRQALAVHHLLQCRGERSATGLVLSFQRWSLLSPSGRCHHSTRRGQRLKHWPFERVCVHF